ncbi:MAG: TetR/AcrR family transcriptional regulator [Clostridiales bacterium]|nr:TetR/AcrR family transcriptional regulator [Clostridiales bacterium]
MAQETKQAIIKTFMQLLNEKSFDKITVTDIVSRCGINRNTFYYYYQDIYELLEEIFTSETDKIIKKHQHYDTWEEAFFIAVGFARINKKAIYHIFNSVNRQIVEDYLYKVILKNMTEYVAPIAEEIQADDEDRDALIVFYSSALMYMVILWLQSGMKKNSDEYISRLGFLLDGNIRHSLEKRKMEREQSENN